MVKIMSTSILTHLPPEVIDRQAAGRDRLRSHISRRRTENPTSTDPADGALRHGRDSNRCRWSRDPPMQMATVIPGSLLGWRIGLRLRSRRQSARHQLAGRPGRLRSPRRSTHARVRQRPHRCQPAGQSGLHCALATKSPILIAASQGRKHRRDSRTPCRR